MRLFIGIPLADNVAGELSALVSRLRGERGTEPGASGLRWTPPEFWHITLQFLGNCTPEGLQCLAGSLCKVRNEPFQVELGELGCFDRAGGFFADVVVSPALATLQQRVVSATGACGFVAEQRPFHPHITLAKKAGNQEAGNKGPRERGNEKSRPRGVRNLMANAGVCQFSRFTAHEFLVYESRLSSEGWRYEIRGRFPLSGRKT
jgi:2'-5' RNA ligase